MKHLDPTTQARLARAREMVQDGLGGRRDLRDAIRSAWMEIGPPWGLTQQLERRYRRIEKALTRYPNQEDGSILESLRRMTDDEVKIQARAIRALTMDLIQGGASGDSAS